MLPRVLVVTAAVSARDLQRAASYGLCGVVTKPFEVETLLATVKKCAGSTTAIPSARCFVRADR